MDELTPEECHELKADLEQLKIQLQQQLEQAIQSSQVVSLDQQAVGRVSRIDAIQQQSMAVAGKQQCEIRLRQVLRALSSFDDEEYGYCRSCDEPIGYKRLKVRPETPLCLSCQANAEQQ
ncbi:TraR/DksA C4-type zinc finger protein [Sansalvadorimonas sp. 2012CJ34-2]|uniref:TraR/DksA C4-type zinc finger protein n=1 Tax=Parendozoicomonas callyspongiae TaxID=2942213 RepID=A0ABT0PB87_9GAMM|nr:TraR/DksA C4-type zinc finger protein [Sansalvadorimonas sp. 2012CJ34-2]MCL6268619.1 TraR/DksA C4-type zinc finger protein [Sansalvadorimonas sp. 2012CJ34-2]